MAGYPRDCRSAVTRTAVCAVLALGVLGGCSDAEDASPRPVDQQVDPDSPTPTPEGDRLDETEAWLYQRLAGRVAAGGSGTRRSVEVDGAQSAHSTSFWVGCEGRPASARFALAGEYGALRTTLLLDPETPRALRVRVRLLGDGEPHAAVTLTHSSRIRLEVDDLTGVRILRLTARALNPEVCEVRDVGYGIAQDAVLSRF